jgi:hypothetical protein
MSRSLAERQAAYERALRADETARQAFDELLRLPRRQTRQAEEAASAAAVVKSAGALNRAWDDLQEIPVPATIRRVAGEPR